MFKNGFALIAPEYVSKDERNYHIFEARQHILTEEIVLKSRKSVCGTVLLNKKPICRRFEENLNVLSAWAEMMLEDQFCGICSDVSVVADERNSFAS
ncbi:MAG: hypothetical protein IJ846_06345 [Alphaproteobacteria bacterium]|nr:hypothetical protein [Alphaproteobacteria bacterium]